MHLKSLTLKGFKSFASATTLRFEPGITCVVGPNGSGKSNVVDAIAWVLGEQGAKALRGGKMEDVIFAGTSGRAPLGRAEVTLTIDNSDGAIPIDYTEVSITRRMFRSGEGEYEINGDRCRLLDIQDLLSDSGIGREMHVLVGQGKLDSYLHARPEDRRAFIEEAAGVLKHRKRKEKALRKLEAMEANLNRLNDLTSELRRQLKPLGRQAELARRAAGIQADLRDARQRLLADDLAQLRTGLARDLADENSVRAKRERVEAAYNEVAEQLTTLESELAADAPALTRAQETWYRLSALQERLRSTGQLAAERVRYLSEEAQEERPGRDPEQLEAEAVRVREQETELRDALVADQERLTEAVDARQETEQALSEAEKNLVEAVKAVAARREGLAKLTGQVGALRSRSQAAADEIARIASSLAQARDRAEACKDALSEAQSQSDFVDAGDVDLEERLTAAQREVEQAKARVKELATAERAAHTDATQWKAREEALAMGLRRKDGAGALLGKAEQVPGFLGSISALLTVEPGYEAALAASLGRLADAVAVSGGEGAVSALQLLKADDAGQASLLLASGAPGAAETTPADITGLPEGVVPAANLVKVPAELSAAVARTLAGMVIVDTLDLARDLVASRPELTAVTRDGDVLGRDWAVGGSASGQSFIEVQAAVDEARDKRAESEARAESLAAQLEGAREDETSRQTALEAMKAKRAEADKERNAVARKLAELGAAANSAEGEVRRLSEAKEEAETARDTDLAGLAELEEQLRIAESAPDEEDPSTAERDRLAVTLQQSRQNEMETRLAVRTAEERVAALAGRADGLARQAAAERQARERAAVRKAARQRGAAIAGAVAQGVEAALARIAESLDRAAAERDAAQQAKTAREAAVTEARKRVREHGAELERLTDAVHRDEVARTEQRLRIEQLEARAGEEFGIDVDTLIAEYGPEQPVPPSAAELAKAEADGKPEPMAVPFERAVQEKRAARGERELKLLGKVNPLALEEFAALEERYKFLSEQLDDLTKTRKDLLSVVKEVDDRILDVFTEAYHDVAREFEHVFATVFPGGDGRLLLTDPDNMLTTGIEVEARPPGKKVKRLSLLSGGERSLTAIALLCAIFKARPSPFYLMDEVEAALDDVNLGRLLTLLTQLRESSQLLVITHQKRTMEVADALYGVTMRSGVTQVISQRLSQSED
ncbi:chromosome segregation protein SMC [Stackebrandtia nassauensis]|uniref:Chromosome partition protein Smc n=1 Tax=Stackebrandtia nassauensis (strain DSM 44728 / CIP 108903 / NRRL B-16338 / NBRC 102104 / LLR-40K-21) TaxID=446470 RepID=D3Q1V1_STANL|nr:chromosome segregation protein SMC [Stackebrandtia nassauensis]ADD41818.1 chromosome segregation protein SMC [Stackebrandtia nassauensis DSM 44728]